LFCYLAWFGLATFQFWFGYCHGLVWLPDLVWVCFILGLVRLPSWFNLLIVLFGFARVLVWSGHIRGLVFNRSGLVWVQPWLSLTTVLVWFGYSLCLEWLQSLFDFSTAVVWFVFSPGCLGQQNCSTVAYAMVCFGYILGSVGLQSLFGFGLLQY
jgi:hypothetical protein